MEINIFRNPMRFSILKNLKTKGILRYASRVHIGPIFSVILKLKEGCPNFTTIFVDSSFVSVPALGRLKASQKPFY